MKNQGTKPGRELSEREAEATDKETLKICKMRLAVQPIPRKIRATYRVRTDHLTIRRTGAGRSFVTA